MRLLSYIFLVFVFCASPLGSQTEASPTSIDSLQEKLLSNSIQDTTLLQSLGEHIASQADTEEKFLLYHKISELYFHHNALDESLAYSFMAKEVAEHLQHTELMCRAYGSIANQYSYLHLNDKARAYLNRAILAIEKLPDSPKKHNLNALSFLEMGLLYSNDDEYLQAKQHYERALDEFAHIKDTSLRYSYHYRRSLYHMGNTYYYLHKPDSALFYLDKALYVKDYYNPKLVYFIYATLGEVYALKGDYQRAVDTLETVVKDTSFNNIALKAEVYFNLSKNYQHLEQDSMFAFYNEKYLELQPFLKSQELDAIDTAFSAEEKSYKASLSQSHNRATWLIWCLVIFVVLSAGFILYLFKRKKREKRLYLNTIDRLTKALPPSKPLDKKAAQSPSLSSEVARDLLKGLDKFESTQGFNNTKLTLSTLAAALETNATYLSTVIKEHKNKTFNSYINELRIHYICEQIHYHPEYLKYKISYLAESCGFTSHSTFSTIFKNVTGISPSKFLKEEEKRRLKNP